MRGSCAFCGGNPKRRARYEVAIYEPTLKTQKSAFSATVCSTVSFVFHVLFCCFLFFSLSWSFGPFIYRFLFLGPFVPLLYVFPCFHFRGFLSSFIPSFLSLVYSSVLSSIFFLFLSSRFAVATQDDFLRDSYF